MKVMELQKSYVRALHRAAKPRARPYMFTLGAHNVNGFGTPRSLSEDDFRQMFPDGGRQITYVRPATYQLNLSIEISASSPST
jgi:hypothetical protein